MVDKRDMTAQSRFRPSFSVCTEYAKNGQAILKPQHLDLAHALSRPAFIGEGYLARVKEGAHAGRCA
jgi:hypothetical protein